VKGTWVQDSNERMNIVFIHGFLSNGEACWTNDNGTYWPAQLAADNALSAPGVYVFEYKTTYFSGDYRISDAVDALKEHLRLDNVLATQAVIFVCHSMGGIVARKYLVERAPELIAQGLPIGLFLIASPSLGSAYGTWFSAVADFFEHSQAGALKLAANNVWLSDLDKEFLNLKEEGLLRLVGKELIEDQFIVLKKLFKRQVVERHSGSRYFGEPVKIPNSDHFTIAKPADTKAFQYRLLLDFVRYGLSASPRINRNSGVVELQSSLLSAANVRASASAHVQRNFEEIEVACAHGDVLLGVKRLRELIVGHIDALVGQHQLITPTDAPQSGLEQLRIANVISCNDFAHLELALSITAATLYDQSVSRTDALNAVRSAALALGATLSHTMEFKLKEHPDGTHSFEYLENGKTVFFGDKCGSHDGALNGIKSARNVVKTGNKIEIKTLRDGTFCFSLIARNGQIIATSIRFSTREALNTCLADLKRRVELAPIVSMGS
jgi:uncharacterized protein YegP (UPF0339 family)/pimeloyl-ACP methyl ester carboxylesterase